MRLSLKLGVFGAIILAIAVFYLLSSNPSTTTPNEAVVVIDYNCDTIWQRVEERLAELDRECVVASSCAAYFPPKPYKPLCINKTAYLDKLEQNFEELASMGCKIEEQNIDPSIICTCKRGMCVAASPSDILKVKTDKRTYAPNEVVHIYVSNTASQTLWLQYPVFRVERRQGSRWEVLPLDPCKCNEYCELKLGLMIKSDQKKEFSWPQVTGNCVEGVYHEWPVEKGIYRFVVLAKDAFGGVFKAQSEEIEIQALR